MDNSLTAERRAAFDAMVQPLMDWLRDNVHPHASVIVTSERAELVEGVRCYRRPSAGTVPWFLGAQRDKEIYVVKALRSLTACPLKDGVTTMRAEWPLSACPLLGTDGKPLNMLRHRAELEQAGAIIVERASEAPAPTGDKESK